MIDKDFKNLVGKILVATPYMLTNGIFHKSLIYMLSHTEDGAMGLIFNHLVNQINFKSFFKLKDDQIKNELMMPVYLGGPVENERGFFLHSNDYNKNLLLEFSNGLVLSSNPEISIDIAQGLGPKENIFIIGYTAWNAGELEQELKNNLWIVMDCEKEFIFEGPPEHKWSNALKKLGIYESQFASQIGSA